MTGNNSAKRDPLWTNTLQVEHCKNEVLADTGQRRVLCINKRMSM